MIDPRLLRDDPDRVRAAQAKRGLSDEVVDRALAADAARRAGDRRLRGQAGRAEGARQADPARRRARRSRPCWPGPRSSPAEVKAAEAAQTEAEEAWRDDAIMAIPNLAADEAPAGGEDDFVVLEHVGTPRDFAAEGFEPRDHVELGRMLGAIDIERGAKVSRLALLLPHRRRRRARVRAGQPGDGPGPRRRLHPGDRAVAGQAARDGGHRLPRPGRRRRLPDRGRGPLPRRHVRGRRWRRTTPTRSSTPARCRCATPRSARASARRPARTARTPGASSACTGSTRSRCSSTRPSRSRTPSTSGCWRWEKEFLDKLELAYRVIDVAAGDLGLSRAAQVRLRGVDPDARAATASSPRPPTAPTSRPAASTSAAAATATGRPRRSRPSTARCARSPRTIVAILETHQQADGSVARPAGAAALPRRAASVARSRSP